ncbi:unnamed protein product [Parnassius apollo]|uniref:(apollo) hypothetical protein n=1 Tax=Parnassius apollo TaxID=110799 RepID=A0A8S3WX04_PARAO|nr:unnamed protein product [Parnassius apollo]
MTEELRKDNIHKATSVQSPRPSSPRKFFARIYGHLEAPQQTPVQVVEQNKQESDSESCSDVEIGENENLKTRVHQLWTPPPPLPLCPRPMLLPHQQIAFGAGLAAFCK